MVDVELAEDQVAALDAWWRAANYLSVGQIYLMDNPLLRRPLVREDIKPRLLGHWGTTPGLNLLWTHLNRLIRERDVDAIFLAGPGHGGPAAVANAWLEGTYSEVYPHVGDDARACRSCSASSPSPAAYPATWHPRRRARSTRAASSATSCRTRTAPRWTTRTSSSRRSSGTASSRPVRWRPRGTPTSSSTRSTTARCCRSCTSTATRSPTRPSRRGSRATSCSTCSAATGTRC